MQPADQQSRFADDLKEVLAAVSSLTKIEASEIVSPITKDGVKARRFCVFAMGLRGHHQSEIAAAFKLSYKPIGEATKMQKAIIRAVSQVSGIDPETMLSESKASSVVRARFMLAALAKECQPWLSQVEIAQLMKRSHHVTGRHALIQAQNLLDTDETFRSAMQKARELLA